MKKKKKKKSTHFVEQAKPFAKSSKWEELLSKMTGTAEITKWELETELRFTAQNFLLTESMNIFCI